MISFLEEDSNLNSIKSPEDIKSFQTSMQKWI